MKTSEARMNISTTHYEWSEGEARWVRAKPGTQASSHVEVSEAKNEPHEPSQGVSLAERSEGSLACEASRGA